VPLDVLYIIQIYIIRDYLSTKQAVRDDQRAVPDQKYMYLQK
jgi:hypothetical protein